MESNRVKYEVIMAESLRRQEEKTMGWCATLGLFIFIFIFCIKHNGFLNIAPQPPYSKINEAKTVCDLKQHRYDICYANGDIRVMGNSSTIFVISNATHTNKSWNIRPYARKGDKLTMGYIRNLTIKKVHNSSHQQIRNCTRKYDVPAVVFSTGGFAGNLFHDFTDFLIPLYQTSHEFDGEVQFLITDMRPWWMRKFDPVLRKMSKYEAIDFDNVKRQEVLCFPRMIVGLKANKEFSINVTASDNSHSYSMKNFTEFLRSAYGLKRAAVAKWTQQPRRLLIISRNKTRRILNEGEVSAMAKGLGFDVVVREPKTKLTNVSKFVNGFDVMVGVHGAGLANMVFLPQNAIVVQVVGLGMDWIARNDYEIPTMDMGLRYLGYKIGVNESSLADQYRAGHQVLSNPSGIKGWIAYSELYLDRQNIKLDVNRFRGTLLKALQLLGTN